MRVGMLMFGTILPYFLIETLRHWYFNIAHTITFTASVRVHRDLHSTNMHLASP